MRFSIIPEYEKRAQTLALTKEYQANLEYNDFWHPEIYEDAKEVDRRIEAYLEMNRDRSGDTLHAAFLGLDLAAIDPVIRDRSRQLYGQSLEIANRLGVKGVVVHTGLLGGLRADYYLEHWLQEAVTFWTKKCAEYPRLTVYLENTFEQEPDIFLAIMERMKKVPNFKLCLDYSHAILTQTPVFEWCRQLAPYIGHVHVNDNDLKNDLHLVPGEGSIDFAEWKRLMEEYHIDTSVLLEVTGLEKAQPALAYMKKQLNG